MRQDLKNAIILCLIQNPNAWKRVNECHKHFHRYIYDENGNALEFGGQEVSDFICNADKLIYDRKPITL